MGKYEEKEMRSLIPTLASLQVMLMHPRRRLQVIAGAFVIFCLLSYVIISPTNKEPSRHANAGAKKRSE